MRALLFMLLLSAPAFAQGIYTWTDKQGVTHFTDDPSQIPKTTRAQITTGADISTVSFPAAPTTSEPLPAPQGEAGPEDEQLWRQRFQEARDMIARIKEAIAEDAKIVEPSGLPVTGKYSCYAGPYNTVTRRWGASACGYMKPDEEFLRTRQRLAENRERLKQWQDYASWLDRQASEAGVPQKWRMGG